MHVVTTDELLVALGYLDDLRIIRCASPTCTVWLAPRRTWVGPRDAPTHGHDPRAIARGLHGLGWQAQQQPGDTHPMLYCTRCSH